MTNHFKHIILIILIALLALPLFQHGTKLFNVRPLNGDFVLTQRPQLTWKSWMDGSFQRTFDRYIEDHIGFRPFFIRLNNQLDFSLFSKANAEGIVLGKNSMLFEYDYIRAYLGEDFIGEETLEKKLLRMQFLNRYLKQEFDIDLILVLEPSKARTYAEKIPDHYLRRNKTLSNYEYIAQRAPELDIPLLDLNRLFLLAGDTVSYPLYPRYGTHWSEYTMTFIADTIIRFLEDHRQIAMPGFRVEKLTYPDGLPASDYDGERTMNLLWRLSHRPMPYPIFSFYEREHSERPMVLAVADSYYWNFFNTRIPRNLFANEAFWYFNARVYPDSYIRDTWTRDLDLRAEVEKQDIIMLSITERFLYKVDWNFIDQVYRLYTPEYSGDIVYKYENLLRLNAEWFDKVLADAVANDIPLEKAIRQEAHYQALTKEPRVYLTWHGVEHFKNIIRNDPNWAAAIDDKAVKAGIPFEQQLELDALYVFSNNHPDVFRKHQLIREYMNTISADSAWMSSVIEKANFYNMPTYDMLQADAEYLAMKQLSNPAIREEQIKAYENAIKNDPAWLEAVRQKAAERNIPLDEMIRQDAIYMLEQKEK